MKFISRKFLFVTIFLNTLALKAQIPQFIKICEHGSSTSIECFSNQNLTFQSVSQVFTYLNSQYDCFEASGEFFRHQEINSFVENHCNFKSSYKCDLTNIDSLFQKVDSVAIHLNKKPVRYDINYECSGNI
jgi:hypothetical protein